MTARVCILVALLGVGYFVLSLGAAPQTDKAIPGKEMKEFLAKLPNTGEQEGERIASRLSAESVGLQTQLILQLASPKSKQHQIVVVYLLGLYRMDGAARELAKVITLEVEGKGLQKRLPLWGRYPTVDALIRIGMPSIPAMMERIETAEDELVVKLGAMVIDRVLGRELGEMAIKQAIVKQPNRKKREKLEESLEMFKTKIPR